MGMISNPLKPMDSALVAEVVMKFIEFIGSLFIQSHLRVTNSPRNPHGTTARLRQQALLVWGIWHIDRHLLEKFDQETTARGGTGGKRWRSNGWSRMVTVWPIYIHIDRVIYTCFV